MEVIYTGYKYGSFKKSVFLAGPTPRDKNVSSWRSCAIKLFKELGFDGELYIPEEVNKPFYDDEIGFDDMNWDQNAIEKASVVMFWMPRSDDMLGLSSNVEFGYLLSKGNIIYGRPDSAFRCEFLDFLYESKLNRKHSNTLEDTVKEVISYLKGV